MRVPIFQIRDIVAHGSELYRIGHIRVDHGDTEKEPTYDIKITGQRNLIKVSIHESELKKYQQPLF